MDSQRNCPHVPEHVIAGAHVMIIMDNVATKWTNAFRAFVASKPGSVDVTKQAPVLVAAALLMLAWTTTAAAVDSRVSGPGELVEAKAGELLLTLRRATNGIGVVGLRDLTWNEPLLATNPVPLFSVTLRHEQTKQERLLSAAEGWHETGVRKKRDGFEHRWRRPAEETFGDVSVVATATLDRRLSAIRWNLRGRKREHQLERVAGGVSAAC